MLIEEEVSRLEEEEALRDNPGSLRGDLLTEYIHPAIDTRAKWDLKTLFSSVWNWKNWKIPIASNLPMHITDDKHNENNNSDFNIDLNFNKNINLTSNKRRICSRLYSAKISVYINCTPANFGDSCHVEIIAKEIWKNIFKKEFSRKKLNLKEKKILNC
ncbi:hypothetical protein RhiirC2_789642 [Rhizophagus irregularis]|uniref:Uncharacterized protein n=1 Tax=Rhizophagus irregularis TaxID=588596 RepID=A0A2N1MMR0_9GLOM|nr:hypothetical protein RhiirC2_789642 [Rhizophagus irregularis]